MPHQRLFILHGYQATPDSHWFNWLARQLRGDGVEVHVPVLPAPLGPQVDDWMEVIARQVGEVDEHTWFVAHSLGCVTLLHFLSSLSGEPRIGGMILVAGFAVTPPRLPELAPFVQAAPPYKKLKGISPRCEVFVSLDDPIVPPADTQDLAIHLRANLHQVENGGHFMESDGFQRFPALLEHLRDMMNI